MRNYIKRLIEKDLGNAKDNVYRARISFAGKTEAEMNEKYGKSGRTCREILDDYLKWEREAETELRKLNTNFKVEFDNESIL